MATSDKENMMDILKHLRIAIEELEDLTAQESINNRRHAELHLAWHKIMDGYCLISTGNLTPDDVLWASNSAKKLLNTKE